VGTVILGWDPNRGTRWAPPFAHALATFARAGSVTTPWAVGPCHEPCAAPPAGTRVHLMLQGGTRGLVGRGTVRSAAFPAADPTRPGALGAHVLVEWDHLLPVADRIAPEELAARVPEIPWSSLYAPTHPLTDDEAARLDRVWAGPHPSARPGPTRRPLRQPRVRSAAAL
jgi:hypothetical protein